MEPCLTVNTNFRALEDMGDDDSCYDRSPIDGVSKEQTIRSHHHSYCVEQYDSDHVCQHHWEVHSLQHSVNTIKNDYNNVESIDATIASRIHESRRSEPLLELYFLGMMQWYGMKVRK